MPGKGLDQWRKATPGQRARVMGTFLGEQTEEEVQRDIITALTACGYNVFQTTVRGVRGGYGSTPGVPDLLVFHAGWSAGLWVGVEVKGPKTRLSGEQALLAEAGRVIVARSVESAIQQVQAVEREAFGRVFGTVPSTRR